MALEHGGRLQVERGELGRVEALDQDLRAGDQRLQDRAIVAPAEVEDDRTLAAVGGVKPGRRARDEGRALRAGVVAGGPRSTLITPAPMSASSEAAVGPA
jgi:hypothetical protein